MFNKPVVFIIGAGASYEYSFPLGSTLKAAIAPKLRFRFEYGHRLTSGDHELLEHIRRHTSDHEERNRYTRSANVLADAMEMFISIDEALHYVSETPQAVEIGKAAIVGEILAAEKQSTLALSRDTGRAAINEQNGAWISQVLSMAVAGLQKKDLHTAFANVTFINFNYDRSLRHYIYNALQQNLGAKPEEAKEIAASVNIIQPYGSLGALEWQEPGGIAYGYGDYVDLFALSKNMRTYTEEYLHDSALIDQALSKAKVIIFLGFGFHAQNVDLLAADLPNQEAAIYGTALGVHSGVQPAIVEQILSKLGMQTEDPLLLQCTATQLLVDFRRRILFELS